MFVNTGSVHRPRCLGLLVFQNTTPYTLSSSNHCQAYLNLSYLICLVITKSPNNGAFRLRIFHYNYGICHIVGKYYTTLVCMHLMNKSNPINTKSLALSFFLQIFLRNSMHNKPFSNTT